jgi:hypothetical protein
MIKTFEIYYNDLTDDKKSEYLDFVGVDSETELNHEFSPLVTIEIEVEREESNGKTE